MMASAVLTLMLGIVAESDAGRQRGRHCVITPQRDAYALTKLRDGHGEWFADPGTLNELPDRRLVVHGISSLELDMRRRTVALVGRDVAACWWSEESRERKFTALAGNKKPPSGDAGGGDAVTER